MTEEQSLVFSRGQLLLATNYGLALSLPLSHTPTIGKRALGQISFGTIRKRSPAGAGAATGVAALLTPFGDCA